MLFKKRSFEKVDTFIIVFCISAAILSSAWLAYDIAFNRFGTEGNTPLGKMTTVKNHVKRKFNKSLIWYDASKEEVVYENDWVFTGSESEVTIVLDDGGEFTIDPDSLVVLSRNNGVLNLNLQHGSMLANVPEKVEVNVIKEGKVQPIKKLARNKRITTKKKIKPRKVAKKSTGDIKLQFPQNTETVWLKENELHTLRWEGNESVKAYKIEVSQTEDFKKPIARTFNKTNTQLKLKESGKYYWRVSASDNPQVTSAVNSFNLKINKTPIVTSQLNPEETLELTSNNGKVSPAPLSWTDQYNSWNSYDIQISKSSTFDDILVKGNGIDTLYNFVPPSSGTYYWRIRGLDETGAFTSAWSDPNKINLKITEKVKKAIRLTR